MRKPLILGITLVLIALFTLAGCGGGGNSTPGVNTLTVSGTVDYTSPTVGVSKGIKAAVTGVTVSVYDFDTTHLYGTATTNSTGAFSIQNIPVGADLLLVVSIKDDANITHRYSTVIAHVQASNAQTTINAINSAVSEILGKLYNKGLDLDPELVAQVYTSVNNLITGGYHPELIPNQDIAGQYGQAIPESNTHLRPIQDQDIMDTAYMKAVDILHHLGYSMVEYGSGLMESFSFRFGYFMMMTESCTAEVLQYYFDTFPDVVWHKDLFKYNPGTYDTTLATDPFASDPPAQTLQTGTWTLIFNPGYGRGSSKIPAIKYRAVFTRNANGQITFELYNIFDSAATVHVGSGSFSFGQTANSITGNLTLSTYGSNPYYGPKANAKDSGYNYKFTVAGTGSASCTRDTSGTVNSLTASLNVTTTATETVSNYVVDSVSGTFGINCPNASTGTLSFDGQMRTVNPADHTQFVSSQGHNAITLVKSQVASGTRCSGPAYVPSHLVCQLVKYEESGGEPRGKSYSEYVDLQVTGKLEFTFTNAATYDFTAPYSATNYPVGSISFDGSMTDPTTIEGQEFNYTFAITGYNAASFTMDYTYDVNNSKNYHMVIATTPTLPFSMNISSTIGVNLAIQRSQTKAFSGSVQVDGQTIGTVLPSSTECTIQFQNEDDPSNPLLVTLYSR